jgi:hypothetical protein
VRNRIEGVDVVIITYSCHATAGNSAILSDEHKDVGFFTEAEVAGLNMPDGYKRSIASWLTRKPVRRPA